MNTHQALCVDASADADHWLAEARRLCRATWIRVGRRYARRLALQHLVRSAEDDVITLAARRLVPQARLVQRPLAMPRLGRGARAFNTLDVVDRAILRGVTHVDPRPGPRAEHAASALLRLVREHARHRERVRHRVAS